MILGGDVMLARGVSQALQQSGPAYPWGDILPILQGADLALVNLECVIAESGQPFKPSRVFYFRAIPLAAQALSLAGIDYVSLANNHTLDFGEDGLLETLTHLAEHGIAHAGAGRNLQEAAQPALLEAGGVKVGVVSFADQFQEYAATASTPGTNVIAITTQPPHFSRVKEAIRAAREAGADIFHGHSAHIFQGIEIYKGKPILYDTGDLVDDYYTAPWLPTEQQFLFLLTASPAGVEKVELIPLVITQCQVNRAGGAETTAAFHRMKELCAEFGSQVDMEGDRLVVRPQEGGD